MAMEMATAKGQGPKHIPMAETATGKTAPIRILMYHHVARFPKPRQQRRLYCHVDQFARQMAYLARSSINVISMDRALDAITGRSPLPGPSIVLTFDDGFQNFHDFAWPILRTHDFPATIFPVTRLLGGRAEFLTHPPLCSDRLMDAATLRQLASEGVDIGGHTATHPSLTKLAHHKRDAEISDAKKELEDILGKQIRHFAYPRGHYDADACVRVAAAGFVSALTTADARADKAPNAFEIPRIGISARDGALRYYMKLHWRYNWYSPQSAL